MVAVLGFSEVGGVGVVVVACAGVGVDEEACPFFGVAEASSSSSDSSHAISSCVFVAAPVSLD